jgi:membrane-bound lytic murein transglycosylase B
MKGKLSIALLIAAVALLATAAARAEESATPSRSEYVSQVEPICQANTEANKTILRNVRQKVRNGKLKQAGRQFIHASAAFGSAVDRITAVPRPPADEERLLKWFKFLRIVQGDLRKVGTALKAGDKILATHETIRVERSANAANNVSYVFEFNYCHLTQSRFT